MQQTVEEDEEKNRYKNCNKGNINTKRGKM
jgi:hypothetical protein